MDLRKRRQVLVRAGALVAMPLIPSGLQAQRPPKVFRVGFLAGTTMQGSFWEMPDALRKLGYEEGRNVVFEIREVKGQTEQVPILAAELVAAKVDVIVVDLPRPTLAVRRATSTIPIVMTFGMVPEELGLIQSLRRPGGNVTGTLIQGPEAAGRTFQVVREILPRNARLAMLYETDYPGLESYVAQWENAATLASLRPARFPVRTEEEVDTALARLASSRIDALSVTPTGAVYRQLDHIFKFATDQRIPVLSPTKWLVEARGALLAFEPNLGLLLIRAAAIVDKVLKGTSPAEIPVEAPTRYELWLNLKTANALGLRIPASVRLQADRVFE